MTNELKIKPMNMLLGLNNAEMEIENVVVDFQGTPTGQTTSKRYNFTDAAKMNERFDKLSEDQKKK